MGLAEAKYEQIMDVAQVSAGHYHSRAAVCSLHDTTVYSRVIIQHLGHLEAEQKQR